jgi:hypothetical protein
VLRGYTDALDAIFLAPGGAGSAHGICWYFWIVFPGDSRDGSRNSGVDDTLASSLRRDRGLHVAVALLTLGVTRATFGRSAVFRAGEAWVRSTHWQGLNETSTEESWIAARLRRRRN